MWYWLCESEPGTGKLVFKVIKCSKTRIDVEKIKKKKEASSVNKNFYWIKEDLEHHDRDYKQYECPECKNLMSTRQLDNTWDWAGPHCNKCGCTGITMFVEVTKNKPVMTGYQYLISKFASILGWGSIEELERKNNRNLK